MAANRTQDTTFLGARHRRLARPIGKFKALVAIQHSILTAVWHVLSEDTDYHDLGGDYHAKRDPQRALDASPAMPTVSATPSASTPSKPHNSPRTSSTHRYSTPVSYTHLRAHETDSYLVCRLLL